MCEDLGVPFLGSLPLDPLLARYCDEGKDYLTELPDNTATKALREIIESMKWTYLFNSLISFLWILEIGNVCKETWATNWAILTCDLHL